MVVQPWSMEYLCCSNLCVRNTVSQKQSRYIASHSIVYLYIEGPARRYGRTAQTSALSLWSLIRQKSETTVMTWGFLASCSIAGNIKHLLQCRFPRIQGTQYLSHQIMILREGFMYLLQVTTLLWSCWATAGFPHGKAVFLMTRVRSFIEKKKLKTEEHYVPHIKHWWGCELWIHSLQQLVENPVSLTAVCLWIGCCCFVVGGGSCGLVVCCHSGPTAQIKGNTGPRQNCNSMAKMILVFVELPALWLEVTPVGRPPRFASQLPYN